MPKKRKKNLQPRQQIRPSVPQVPAEPNRYGATSTPPTMPTPATTPPPTPKKQLPTPATTPPPTPKKQLPTLFTTAEQDELLGMTESEIEQVVPARMDEIFDKDGHDEKMERQLAEAEAKYNKMRSELEARSSSPLSEAARPQRGRPRLDKPVRPRRGRPTNL